MAHFAKISEQNQVEQVIVISNTVAPDPFPASEALGQQFIQNLGLPGVWLQTSYSGAFRHRYAGIGYTYHADLDAFIPPKPYQSWLFDEATLNWQPPVPYPGQKDEYWMWNEAEQNWIQEQI